MLARGLQDAYVNQRKNGRGQESGLTCLSVASQATYFQTTFGGSCREETAGSAKIALEL
jgi:hypothetical protein